jgi:hypothetical protein
VLALPSAMGALVAASARLGALLLSVWVALSDLLGHLATTAGPCLVCAGLLA